MRVALLQFNPVVGAFEANARSIEAQLRAAERAAAALGVCSELAILGYPPKDLLEQPRFVNEAQRWTEWLVRQTRSVPLIFGTVGLHQGRLTNDAVVAVHGTEQLRCHKQLLPNYDVFDEQRHFHAGTTLGRIELAGLRCAISICEDAWAYAPGLAPRYDHDPLAGIAASNTDLLINLSASPFTLSKLQQRRQLFSGVAERLGVPLLMVNQVGGNDELVFDGRSSLFDRTGELLAQAKMFEPELLVAELGQRAPITPDPDEAEAAYRALVVGIKDYAAKCGFTRAVLGLSGGIDSALVATLAADALGPAQVLGVAMPTRYSSAHSLSDARALANNLGIQFETIDIDPMFASYLHELSPVVDRITAPRPGDVTWENVQARIRGATLMALSNRTGALALTTGNKSEVAVGYCTLYGDMVGGLAAISDVPKTMVYKLAHWANRAGERIPANSITKPPSAELRPDQKDEDSLPPYDLLDPILEAYVEGQCCADDLVQQGFDAAIVERVLRLVRGAEYKRRQAAPGLIVTRKAFGSGRRVPVAHGYWDLPGNKSQG
jgi:NAD+ synthase (glutamine-hydrolysing)